MLTAHGEALLARLKTPIEEGVTCMQPHMEILGEKQVTLGNSKVKVTMTKPSFRLASDGALGKLFSEAIENCDKGPVEGLQSVGGGWWKRVRFAVLPQVLPLILSYTLLRLEINVRASTILGFVGAGGIGEQLKVVIGWRHGDDVFAIICLLVATIIALDYLSQYVRHRLSGLR